MLLNLYLIGDDIKQIFCAFLGFLKLLLYVHDDDSNINVGCDSLTQVVG